MLQFLNWRALIAQISQSLAAIPAAQELAASWSDALSEHAELHSTLDIYNGKVKDQQSWRKSVGGSLLLAFIKLSQPSEVRVATDLPNSRIQ